MPDNQMKHKAGRISFLLVCLFLCTACGKKEVVFLAGEENAIEAMIEETVSAQEDSKEESVAVKENSQTEMININTAEMTDLMMLPGIGEVRAKAIIEYRRSAGEFQKIEDIMNVKGIKTGIFSKIKSLICVK